MEATEMLRKGTRSDVRVRNCRLRPWPSRSWRSHRLTSTAYLGMIPEFRFWCELCSNWGTRVLFSILWPCLQLWLSLQQLLKAQWETQNLLWRGGCIKTLKRCIFHIKLSKAVGPFPLQISILYNKMSVKKHIVIFVSFSIPFVFTLFCLLVPTLTKPTTVFCSDFKKSLVQT